MQFDAAPMVSSYLRQIADQVASIGGDVDAWLGRQGLQAGQLDDAGLQLSFPVFRLLLLDALAITREPSLGLLIGVRMRAHSHNILADVAMNSGTLRQALDVTRRYLRQRSTMLDTELHQQGDYLRLQLVECLPLGDIARPVLEAVLLAIRNILAFIVRASAPCQLVAFHCAAPDNMALARELFQCEVRYGEDWSGMLLPAAALDLPLQTGDVASWELALQICQRELDKLVTPYSTAARVRKLMLEQHTAFPTLALTARMLHLTPRTLHRRLLAEQTSYQQILDEIRHMLALEYLRSGQTSVQEISHALGYTDMANFRRAFKRWQGVPPTAWRAS